MDIGLEFLTHNPYSDNLQFSGTDVMSNPRHIVCPHCDAVNRIPADNLAAAPACSKCKQALFTAQPLELNDGNFMLHISRNDIPVLVDFWAPWCAPCHMMAPSYEKAARRLEPDMRVARLNTEESQNTAARYNIEHIPTLVLFKDGLEVGRKPGAVDAALIEAWVKTKL